MEHNINTNAKGERESMKRAFFVALVVSFLMMGGLAFADGAANFYAGAGVSGQYEPGSVDSDPPGWGVPVYIQQYDVSVGGGGASTPGTYSGNFSTENGYGSYGGSISVNGGITSSSAYSRVRVFGNPE